MICMAFLHHFVHAQYPSVVYFSTVFQKHVFSPDYDLDDDDHSFLQLFAAGR